MVENIVLIRHACPGEDFKGRFIGSMDVPLSAEGAGQAARLTHVLERVPQGACLSSPMKRSLETARIAGGPLAVQLDLDPDLREIDFGELDGLTFDEINARYPEPVAQWAGFDLTFTFPGGERIADFLDRIERVGRKLASLESETAVVFTHGGVIRALICYFLGLEPSQYVLFEVAHASVTTLRIFGDRGILACLNDTCHLRGM